MLPSASLPPENPPLAQQELGPQHKPTGPDNLPGAGCRKELFPTAFPKPVHGSPTPSFTRHILRTSGQVPTDDEPEVLCRLCEASPVRKCMAQMGMCGGCCTMFMSLLT
eukprot:355996-Chlamydomonas_euryale.AAC.2